MKITRNLVCKGSGAPLHHIRESTQTPSDICLLRTVTMGIHPSIHPSIFCCLSRERCVRRGGDPRPPPYLRELRHPSKASRPFSPSVTTHSSWPQLKLERKSRALPFGPADLSQFQTNTNCRSCIDLLIKLHFSVIREQEADMLDSTWSDISSLTCRGRSSQLHLKTRVSDVEVMKIMTWWSQPKSETQTGEEVTDVLAHYFPQHICILLPLRNNSDPTGEIFEWTSVSLDINHYRDGAHIVIHNRIAPFDLH